MMISRMIKLTKLNSSDYSKLLGLNHLNSFVLTSNVDSLVDKIATIRRDVVMHKNERPPVIFVADFDNTLTKPSGLTSWSIIDSHPELSDEFKLKCMYLAIKHYPSEVSTTISLEEKNSVLEQWYNDFHRYICDEKLTYDDWCRLFRAYFQASGSYNEDVAKLTEELEDIMDIENWHLGQQRSGQSIGEHAHCKVQSLRDGYTAFSERLQESKIAQIIVSAGQGFPILHALHHEQLHHNSRLHAVRAEGKADQQDSIQVCSNWCQFDESGQSIGYFPERPIHVYAKADVPEVAAAQETTSKETGSARVHMILAGDSLGDQTIEYSGKLNDQVLKIGVLNVPPQLSLEALTMQHASRKPEKIELKGHFSDSISVRPYSENTAWNVLADPRVYLPEHDADCCNVLGLQPSIGKVTCIYDLLRAMETGCPACQLDKWRSQLLRFTDKFDVVVLGDASMRGMKHVMDAIEGRSNGIFEVDDDNTVRAYASRMIPTETGFQKLVHKVEKK